MLCFDSFVQTVDSGLPENSTIPATPFPPKHVTVQVRTLTKASRLAPPAPRNVGSNEESPPEATKHSQKDERDELKQVPRCVVLNIEQHQAAVTKRVDGAQDEGCHEGSEK